MFTNTEGEQMSRAKWNFCTLKHMTFVSLQALMAGNIFKSHIAQLLHFTGEEMKEVNYTSVKNAKKKG